MPIMKMRPMDGYLADVRAPTRWALVLIGTFAAIALILAVVGLFGVLSTMVRQRTAEIGVRMAFGASRERIFRLMVGEGMRLSAVGLLLGGLAALVLTRTMRSMLVGVTPQDPPRSCFSRCCSSGLRLCRLGFRRVVLPPSIRRRHCGASDGLSCSPPDRNPESGGPRAGEGTSEGALN